MYGVSTKRLNEQVKRNKRRFPSDFMFQLTTEEFTRLRSQVVTVKTACGQQRKYGGFLSCNSEAARCTSEAINAPFKARSFSRPSQGKGGLMVSHCARHSTPPDPEHAETCH
ncbi:MAG TPA: ORF6N domain-containing protein [Nitrospiraceae bacterium]|nr:ORF6N domain-containing protein [Nitrospiraceae bacterium]